jgi:hypothetical protein
MQGGYRPQYEQQQGPGAATWGDYTEANTHWRGGPGAYGYRNQAAPPQRWEDVPSKQYGVPWDPAQRWEVVPPPQRKSRRGLWMTLGVIATVLLAMCTGTGFVVAQYFAPVFQVGQFCGSLQAQRYSTGYSMLSTQLRGQLSSNDFAVDAQTLDVVEGQVQKCGAGSGSNGYVYTLGGSTATVAASITRVSAGTLRGNIYLKNQNGWKVDRLDVSLLGIDLGALQAVNSYCAALQAASYTAAYALLGTSLTAHTTAAQYAQVGGWHDTLDGPVTGCAVASLGSTTSADKATLTLRITRGKLGEKKDTLTLDVEGGDWRISTIGPALQGTDVGALVTAARFCTDIKGADYHDVYGLLSTAAKSGKGEAGVAAEFSGAASGIKWDDCSPDASTFKLASSGTSATLTLVLKLTNLSINQTASGPVPFIFVRINSAWLIDGIQAS